jgi:hypothetical protein
MNTSLSRMFATMVVALSFAMNAAHLWAGAPAASFFTVPYDATLYLAPLGGDAGATTEFGLGTSQQNAVPIFAGLPNNPQPAGQVQIGFVSAGTDLNFYEKTDFGSTEWAFSIDTVTVASRVAFLDLNNTLGLGGSIVEPTGPTTWLLHLDDAVSYLFDDDNNDLYVQIRLVPVPEGASCALVAGGLIALTAFRQRRIGNQACGAIS